MRAEYCLDCLTLFFPQGMTLEHGHVYEFTLIVRECPTCAIIAEYEADDRKGIQ